MNEEKSYIPSLTLDPQPAAAAAEREKHRRRDRRARKAFRLARRFWF